MFLPGVAGRSVTFRSRSTGTPLGGQVGWGSARPGYSVLIAENAIEQRQLVNAYLFGQVESVESQIPKRPLADVIFEILCAGAADSEADIGDFIADTFAYLTFYEEAGGGIAAVRNAVAGAVRLCIDSTLVIRDGQRLCPTQMARVFGSAGLTLASASQLSSVVDRAITIQPCKEDLIFAIASCAEVGDRPWLLRRRGIDLDPRPNNVPDSSACPPGSRLGATLAKPTISVTESKALVRVKCLLEWMSGKSQRVIAAEFQNMGAAAPRVRELGKNAAWLLDALAEAAHVRGAAELADQFGALALEARYGLPSPLAPLARLRVPGISREQLLGLYQNEGIELYDPETIVDEPDEAFNGLLSPLQLARLRHAILADIQESIRRKHSGQVARAEQANLMRKLIDDLYATKGTTLEQAVADALNHVGLSATRVLRQPHGEEDIRVAHADGTVIISVTASQDEAAHPVEQGEGNPRRGSGTESHQLRLRWSSKLRCSGSTQCWQHRA